ncbi:MAG: YedE-related selenium metabolism membrane protein [Firmicutes bacterium]|nr:YedE-related selenium metabolism membrane protein [Bacillota bacterium]
MKNRKLALLLSGLLIGAIAVALVYFGNPKNMGFCIACFIRDIAGATGMHQAAVVQYIRPEILGLVLGAFVMSLLGKEFSPRGGSAPVTRFCLGFMVMVAALVFLGCPLRMVLRIAGGDLNAVIGLVGFAAGILAGVLFLKKGYSLKRTYRQPLMEGLLFPGIQVVLLVLLLAAPALLIFSESGPGSMRAPIFIALAAGLIVGALAQRTRLCMVGGIRDLVMFKDWTLLLGFLGILIAALVGNIIFGWFKLSMVGQPVAHIDGLWNALSMFAVGLGSVMLGGCPLRQLILAGEGNSDSAVTVFGYLVGAAFAHNFKLASAATAIAEDGSISGGPTMGGKVVTIAIIVLLLVLAIANTKQEKAK